MKQITIVMLCLGMVAVGTACQKKTEGALVTVGSETITESDLDLLGKVNPRLQRRLESEAGRKQVLDNYVEQELLSQEARKRGLADDETVKAKIALYKKVILAQSLLEDELNRAAQEYYESNGPEFEKIEIAHIYVPFKTDANNPALGKDVEVKRSEEEAKKRIQEAKAKLADQDFDKVAAEYSEDERTKDSGGTLGWVGLDDVRINRWGWTPIVKEVMSLQKDEVSEPIKTVGGYHLVLVKQPVKKEDFDQSQSRIRFTIQQQVKTDLVNSLREEYAVEFTGPKTAPAETSPDAGAAPAEPAPQTEPQVPAEGAAQAE